MLWQIPSFSSVLDLILSGVNGAEQSHKEEECKKVKGSFRKVLGSGQHVNGRKFTREKREKLELQSSDRDPTND